MHPIAMRSPPLAALLLLAGRSLRRCPALPGTPLAAHSGASNYFFWDPSWPLEVAKIEEHMQRWGDEVLMHHEFARDHNGPVVFGLPLIAYFDKDRLYEIIGEFEADGCMVLDNHVHTIEGGGMKTIDTAQIDFKKIADPHGLMNPGKTEGWLPEMAMALAAANTTN